MKKAIRSLLIRWNCLHTTISTREILLDVQLSRLSSNTSRLKISWNHSTSQSAFTVGSHSGFALEYPCLWNHSAILNLWNNRRREWWFFLNKAAFTHSQIARTTTGRQLFSWLATQISTILSARPNGQRIAKYRQMSGYSLVGPLCRTGKPRAPLMYWNLIHKRIGWARWTQKYLQKCAHTKCFLFLT